MEACALRGQYQKNILPPNIRTKFSEAKECTSERPGDISGKEAETSPDPIGFLILKVLHFACDFARRNPTTPNKTQITID